MISSFFYGLLFINIVLVLIKKKSNTIAIMMLIVLFFVYFGNTREGFSDLTYYRERYELITNSIYFSDPGYIWLADFCRENGLSFQMFLAVIFIISATCIIYVAIKFKCDYNLLVVLYSLFYIFYSMEVLRYFIAMSFALIAYYNLSKGNKKRYLFFLIIAVLFHKSIAFLAPFAIIGFINNTAIKKKIFKCIYIFVAIFIVFNIINGNNATFLYKYIDKFISNKDMSNSIQYYVGTTTRYGFILYFMYHIFNTIILYCIRKEINKNQEIISSKLNNFIELTWQQNIYTSLFLPFIMYNVTFFRYIIFNCNLVYICLSSFVRARKKYDYRNNVMSDFHFILTIMSIILFTTLWWYLRENVLLFYEALRENMFY